LRNQYVLFKSPLPSVHAVVESNEDGVASERVLLFALRKRKWWVVELGRSGKPKTNASLVGSAPHFFRTVRTTGARSFMLTLRPHQLLLDYNVVLT